MNAFSFAPAVRHNTHVLIALAGPSGGGKTYTALELATGMAQGHGKIAVIDTEARRALHYADLFKFDHCELTPPFTPDRYREAIVGAAEAGYSVVVIDSMSHEHDGEGGLIEMADQEMQKRKDGNSAAAWALPKTKHKRMMNRLLQVHAHLIFCLRAEEKIKMVKVFDERKGREVTVIEPAGWQPICEKRFMFEMTASFVLTPDNPGAPAQALKLQEQHRAAFPSGKPINRESGRVIAGWAAGGAAPELPESDEFAALDKRAEDAARLGRAPFRAFWQKLAADERDHLRPMLSEFESMATQADAEDDPFDGQTERPEERQSSAQTERREPETVRLVTDATPHGESKHTAQLSANIEAADNDSGLIGWTRPALAECREPVETADLWHKHEKRYLRAGMAAQKEIRDMFKARNRELLA